MTRLPTLLALLLLCASAAANFTVTGRFEYEDKAWTYNGWSGSDPSRPVRRADVYVLNAANDAVLGSGSTDQDGDFSIVCASVGVVDVVVRLDADTDLDGSFQRIRVTTESNVEYSAFSPVFAAHDTSTDLDAGTTTALKITSGGAEANAFNLLDMGVSMWEYVTQGDIVESASGQTVRLYWPGSGGSFASGAGAHISSDDGYDDAVILHELGHVLQNLYSDSDNPGGTHFFGDSDQDPRLSFGEGYATFVGGVIQIEEIVRQALYVDANGSAQNGGVQLRLRLETVEPYANDAKGTADEVAVACTLFDLIDSELSTDQSTGVDDDAIDSTATIAGKNRHQAFWDVFRGPIASAPNLTLNDAWDGWFELYGSGGLHADLVDLYHDRQVEFVNDTSEPNDTIATPLPIVPADAWVGGMTLYASDAVPPVPGSGDRDWFSAPLVVGSVIDFETRYPGGASDADTQADTYLDVFDPSDTKVVEDDDGGTGRNGAITGFAIDQTGTWKFRVRTLNTTSRRYGKYDYRIRYAFQNFAPVVASVTATPSSIADDETTTLDVMASDANVGQVLSYAWTPLDGGSILGGGASVTFDPPLVGGGTTFHVQVVATDPLGATSAPVQVAIDVDPAGGVCLNGASATPGGVGKPGLLGVPLLTPVNLPVLPSGDFALHMTGALPSAPTYIVLGLGLLAAPFDAGTLYPTPDVIVPVTTTPSGEVFLPLPLGADPGACGLSLYWQFMVLGDPGAAGAKKTAQTRYVQTILGS